MFDNLKAQAVGRYGSASLYLTQRSPELLLVAGLGAGVVSAIMLAKAHRKSDEVFADLKAGIEFEKELLNELKEMGENVDVERSEIQEELDKDTEADLAVSVSTNVSKLDEARYFAPYYLEGAKRAALLYGPAVVTGLGALMLILASHNKLRDRNRALVSALTLLQTSLIEYRRRVTEEYGEEAEHRLFYGLDKRVINTVEVTESGKKKKKKSEENVLPETPSPVMYQKVWDETNPGWSADPDIRQWTVFQAEATANLQLQHKGWILLNDVYEMLGIPKTGVGAVVGWSKKKIAAGTGDDTISFGLELPHNNVPGQRAYLLDFNVHGSIIDDIDPT